MLAAGLFVLFLKASKNVADALVHTAEVAAAVGTVLAAFFARSAASSSQAAAEESRRALREARRAAAFHNLRKPTFQLTRFQPGVSGWVQPSGETGPPPWGWGWSAFLYPPQRDNYLSTVPHPQLHDVEVTWHLGSLGQEPRIRNVPVWSQREQGDSAIQEVVAPGGVDAGQLHVHFAGVTVRWTEPSDGTRWEQAYRLTGDVNDAPGEERGPVYLVDTRPIGPDLG